MFDRSHIVQQLAEFSAFKHAEKEEALRLIEAAVPKIVGMEKRFLSAFWESLVMALPGFSHAEKLRISAAAGAALIRTFNVCGRDMPSVVEVVSLVVLNQHPLKQTPLSNEKQAMLNVAFFQNLYDAVKNDCGIDLNVFKEVVKNG